MALTSSISTCIEVEAVLMTRSTVGAHLPAYCTCSGQVQLAGLPNSEVRKRLRKVAMVNRGPNTLSSLPELIGPTGHDPRRGIRGQRPGTCGGPPIAGCSRLLLQRQSRRGSERLGAGSQNPARRLEGAAAGTSHRSRQDQPRSWSPSRLKSVRGLREVRLKPLKATGRQRPSSCWDRDRCRGGSCRQ